MHKNMNYMYACMDSVCTMYMYIGRCESTITLYMKKRACSCSVHRDEMCALVFD